MSDMHGAKNLLALASSLAESLAATAVVSADQCTWLTATVDLSSGERRILHRTGDPSLYQGDAGIAWALAHASRALDRSDLGALARAGARCALRRASSCAGPGLHDGTSGVATAALQVAAVLDDPVLRRDAIDLLSEAATSQPSGSDIITGAAGSLLAMLSAHEQTNDLRWLDRAVALGKAVVDGAQRLAWGWCWPAGEEREPGLCGLAHGAVGVAWALEELHQLTGDERFRLAANHALRYERSWFDRRRSNWPDLRVGVGATDGAPCFESWWCHGAVGEGLVRLRLHALGRSDPAILAEAGAAFQCALDEAINSIDAAEAPIHGLTLCHGLGGTVELFLMAHAVLGEQEHLVTARWILDRALAALGDDAERWPDGLGTASAAPGLMTGAAGALTVLLRAIAPTSIPSAVLFPRA
ncbi:MAG: lanthionine synthetase LanC family protein [bacterium]